MAIVTMYLTTTEGFLRASKLKMKTGSFKKKYRWRYLFVWGVAQVDRRGTQRCVWFT